MSVALPREINYESAPALPSQTQVLNQATQPVNGSSFTPGSVINLDLISRGCLVPDSMYISYNIALTQATAADAEMRGCPAYTPFSSLSVQIGSQSVDTINSYNVLMNMLSNVSLTVSEKYGQQASLAYGPTTAATGADMDSLDGHLCNGALNDTFDVSAPLMSVLSNSEKLLPLFAMGQVRLSLTVDEIANIFTSTKVPSAFTISNVTLRYKTVDFGGAIESMIRQSNPVIQIKSQSFGVSSTTLASGSTGQQDLVFNQRYASCKAIFAINGTSTTTGNQQFDSVNLAAGSAYSFMVGGMQYPQRRLTSSTERAGVMNELRSAVGSVFDRSNTMAINAFEFSFDTTNASTTYLSPGKFYVATSLERLNTDAMLTGISTQNSPITYQITLGAATASASTITLVVNYDAIFNVDPVNGQTTLSK